MSYPYLTNIPEGSSIINTQQGPYYAVNLDKQNVPIQKYYNINMSSPVGNHTTIDRIYEDMLPIDKHNFTMNTYYERSQLLMFFRNTILEDGDYEEISISPGPKKTLLSYIRLLELNPYTLERNPYHGLAKDFIIYNAAYPIRLNRATNNLTIPKDPIGLNVRLYNLSKGAIRSLKLNEKIDMDNFDVYREIKFYEYIRENILKAKVSPNFISLYLHAIDSTSKINYKEINIITSKVLSKGIRTEETRNTKLINNDHKYTNNALNRLLDKLNERGFKNNSRSGDEKADLNEDTDISLMALTEAPNVNILSWASPEYESFGTVERQKETGYHNIKVWKSVLFQLVYSCAVLEKADIYFENFTLANNFYIKELATNPNKRNHWIYKVDDFEFFIPNYGYLLLIDSNFADINSQDSIISIIESKDEDRKYKITSERLYNTKNHSDTIRNNIRHLQAFKKIIDPTEFNNNIKLAGGQQLDEEIIRLLYRMYNDNYENIANYLYKYFPEFLNNRIGTMLTKEEIDVLPNFPDNKFNRGDLVAYQERYGIYKWVLFIDNVESINKLHKQMILVSIDANPIEVFSSQLYKYPNREEIRQNVHDGILLSREYTSEIYNLENIV